MNHFLAAWCGDPYGRKKMACAVGVVVFLKKKKFGGGFGKPEPFVRGNSQCLLKLREVAELAYHAQPPSYSELLCECHGPHEWSTSEDRNVGPDLKTSMI